MKHQNSHTALLFRHTREQVGINVRQMAERLSIPPSNVSRIETGLLTPKKEVVQRLLTTSGAESLEALFIKAYR